MATIRIRSGYGWLGLAIYVWLWDNHAPETLSQGFWRGMAHPEVRLFVLFMWAWVTSHLFFKRPRRILIWW